MPKTPPVAYQVAYGIVGKFSKPPVAPGQFSLMDYRAEHLSAEELAGPPTFLYAMDLGDDVFFVEETSLALAPAMAYDTLKKRLQRRLSLDGVEVSEIHHTEYCLFPMNQPLPDLNQRVLGFGGAASMVQSVDGLYGGGDAAAGSGGGGCDRNLYNQWSCGGCCCKSRLANPMDHRAFTQASYLPVWSRNP